MPNEYSYHDLFPNHMTLAHIQSYVYPSYSIMAELCDPCVSCFLSYVIKICCRKIMYKTDVYFDLGRNNHKLIPSLFFL